MAYIVGPAGPTTSTTRRPKALRLVTEDDECTSFPPPKCVRGSGYGDRQGGWREVAATQGFSWMNEAIRAQQQSTPRTMPFSVESQRHAFLEATATSDSAVRAKVAATEQRLTWTSASVQLKTSQCIERQEGGRNGGRNGFDAIRG